MSIIKDPSLAEQGKRKIEWVEKNMPVLKEISEEPIRRQIFRGFKIGMSIHLEAKTAFLALILKEAGAKVYATGCNPLSTQDDVAAALAAEGVEVYAIHDADEKAYWDHIHSVLANKPDLIIDDGGDLLKAWMESFPREKYPIIGGCEETTTGIHRLHELENQGKLPIPMMDINGARCKHLFDNHHGTGQSVMTAIMSITNLAVAGKTFVVAGYGNCGSGIAKRASGLGAIVIVTETNPVKALQAVMDGFQVMSMEEAAPLGDYFVTATGVPNVITGKHLEKMHDNVFLANAGHFDVEINLEDLKDIKFSRFRIKRRTNIETYELWNGHELHLLAEGRLVNLAAGDGHPAEIMDMSFSLQFLGLKWLLDHKSNLATLPAKVYDIPPELDDLVARTKLKTMGITIDE